MNNNHISAISPIDGRYASKTEKLSCYFSEEALIRYRVRIEVEYLITLSGIIPQLSDTPKDFEKRLRSLYLQFTQEDALRIKEIESVTNHDVKAVEYFIKQRFDEWGWQSFKEFIHFGLTSQDINNTSFPLMLKEAMEDVFLPQMSRVLETLKGMCQEWKEVPMLARTHGQPASPTRLGKEFMVFVYRLEQQLKTLQTIPYGAKFGGATGNFNAHVLAFPNIDWHAFGNGFVASLGLNRELYTTQISNYDHLAALFQNLQRINTILIDLSRDIWTYISMGYFRQRIKAGEVGSSAMPHKVNPIDFENAEGNLGLANALLDHLACKLPISRLQRDLTDSTVIRNQGVPVAYSLIALKSLEKGLGKLLLHKEAIDKDLQHNYAVVAEAIQTILRREGYPNPYETLKELTRTGEEICPETIAQFIEGLDIREEVKKELLAITPFNYIGK
ncbi:MAG: adenylosuccinate lyase [Porphyromonas sp.]|nr:adenylosuccinate lyase [Porphyromonas sp.]